MDVIVDIDGTLADCTHRLYFLDRTPKDWDGFFGAVADDAPIPIVIDLVKALKAQGHHILFCTGRPSRTRKATQGWLYSKAGLGRRSLYMRKDDDHRPDVIVKREMLIEIRAAGFNPIFAIDDRQSVVDMWRAEGLVCAQVADGKF